MELITAIAVEEGALLAVGVDHDFEAIRTAVVIRERIKLEPRAIFVHAQVEQFLNDTLSSFDVVLGASVGHYLNLTMLLRRLANGAASLVALELPYVPGSEEFHVSRRGEILIPGERPLARDQDLAPPRDVELLRARDVRELERDEARRAVRKPAQQHGEVQVVPDRGPEDHVEARERVVQELLDLRVDEDRARLELDPLADHDRRADRLEVVVHPDREERALLDGAEREVARVTAQVEDGLAGERGEPERPPLRLGVGGRLDSEGCQEGVALVPGPLPDERRELRSREARREPQRSAPRGASGASSMRAAAFHVFNSSFCRSKVKRRRTRSRSRSKTGSDGMRVSVT